jgi:hypothetical protein
MALSLDGTTGITSDGGTPVIENLDTTATGIDVTGVLTTTGNVGIGKTSPSAKLDVKTLDATRLAMLAGTTVGARFTTSANGIYIEGTDTTGSASYQPLAIGGSILGVRIAGSEKMRIDGSGTTLIGKSSSGALSTGVQLYPTGTGTAITANVTSNTGPLFYLVNAGSSVPNGYRFVTFRATAGFAEVGTITTNGTSTTSYNTSSDYRLKEDWQPMSGSVDRIKALNPVNFAWKADGSRVDGFLAHEAQAVVPEAITGEKDETEIVDIKDEEGNVTGQEERPLYQGIDQSKLVPLLTAALQEAITKIETLEARVTALENA